MRPRVLLSVLLPLVLTLALAPPTQAAWHPAGDGPVNAASATQSGSFAATYGGDPYVGWTDPGGTVKAARLAGGAWAPVASPPKATSGHTAVLGGLVAAGGRLWAVWEETDGGAAFDVVASGFDGTAWSAAVRLDSTVAAQAFDPTLAAVGGEPYAAWTENPLDSGGSTVRVKRFTTGAWTQVGGPVTHDPELNAFAGSVADVGGVPHVVYTQFEEANSATGLRVAKLSGGAWADVGGLVNGGVLLPYKATIASVGGQPAVAWEDVSDAPFTRTTLVARFSAGTWSALGGGGGVVATHGDLVGTRYSLREVGGVPYLAYSDGSRANVAALNGSTWSTVDSPIQPFGGVGTESPQLSEHAGEPFVTWTEVESNGDDPGQVSIYAGGRGPDTVRLAAATATVAESAGSIDLQVLREGASSEDVSVGYAVSPVSATDGEDFEGSSGLLTFAPGESSKTITVPILDDELVEGDETFTLTIGVPTGDAVLGTPSQQVVTITDDDAIDTQITLGPQGYTTAANADFFFNSVPSGLDLTCWLDSAAPAPCTSPTSYTDLAEGPHTFTAQADGDPSPAVRQFFVDTIRPTATVGLQGQSLGGGKYAGTVTVTGQGADAGSGVAEVRCAVDPPSAPQTASEMTGTCPATVSSPGQHTAYVAAIDNAGWAGIPVTTTFTVAAAPDTTITRAPSAPLWIKAAEFAFTSSTAGSTFRCRIDSAPFAPCSTPYVTGVVSSGVHVFEVAAVSPDGVVDPTPARATFTVLGEVKQGGACVVDNFPQRVPIALHGAVGCEYTTGDFVPDGCDSPNRCIQLAQRCPEGAECVLEARTSWFDADTKVWSARAGVRLNAASSLVQNSTSCTAGLGQDRCQTTARATGLGTSGAIAAYCRAMDGERPANPPNPYPVFGANNVRRVECVASITIRPAAPLLTVPSAKGVQVAAPGAGTLTIAPGGTSKRVGIAAKAKFKPVKKTVKAAGPVAVKLKLSKAAKKTLRKKGKLKLTVALTFRTASGATTKKTVKVVLRSKR